MTTVRTIFHRDEGVRPLGLDEALAGEDCVEFYAGPIDAALYAFTLHKVGIGILVRDDNGRRVGIYADPAQAIALGFKQFDRPRRVRRRTASEVR